MKLTIAVAIYNGEQYLHRCVDQILAQTFTDFEVLLIDDESPDKCPEICDEYALKDSRVRVIHKKNGGLAESRKTALKEARGEYIMFTDGDDWMEKDYAEKMLSCLSEEHQVDVVYAGYVEDDGKNLHPMENWFENGIYYGEKMDYIHKNAIYIGAYYKPGVWACYWTKLYRRQFLLDNGVCVDGRVVQGEDAAFTYTNLAYAKCIAVNNEIKSYHYRVSGPEESMSKKFDPIFFKRVAILFDGMDKEFRKSGNEIYWRNLDFYKLHILEMGFIQLISQNKELTVVEKKKIVKENVKSFGINEMYKRADKSQFTRAEQFWHTLLGLGMYGFYIRLRATRYK